MAATDRTSGTFLYEEVQAQVREMIDSGVLGPGDKAPSLRKMSRLCRVSIATVSQAYLHLEQSGLIEAREKSGFFVRRQPACAPTLPRAVSVRSTARVVRVSDIVESILESAHRSDVTSLGLANPSTDLLPVNALARAMSRVSARQQLASIRYSQPLGVNELRRQIAYRSREFGCQFGPDDLIITSGATEGLASALQVVAKSGDAIAVESPCYFQVLRLIESLGLLAVEVRADPDTGLNLDALDRAMQQVPVKAVVCVPNFHNPLGALMPEANKRRLVRMLDERNVTLIEDDVYGDLYYGEQRPWAAKAFDEFDNVILCSSFSKTLAPGYRIGWIAPGKFGPQVRRLKIALSGTTASVTQLTVSEFLATGAYDKTMRTMRRAYARQVEQTRQSIAEHFPVGTRISQPAGGFVLWVQLPDGCDGDRLFRQSLEEKVSITPGSLFSSTRRFGQYIRISAGQPWSARIENGIATVGKLARSMAKSAA